MAKKGKCLQGRLCLLKCVYIERCVSVCLNCRSVRKNWGILKYVNARMFQGKLTLMQRDLLRMYDVCMNVSLGGQKEKGHCSFQDF